MAFREEENMGYRFTASDCDCSMCLHYKRLKCTAEHCVCLKDKLRSGSKIRNEADLEWLAHNEVDPAWLEEEDY